MMYALIEEDKKTINRIKDSEFLNVPEGSTVIELTDEQASKIENSESIFHFFEEEVITRREYLWKTNPDQVKNLIRPSRNKLLAESDWTQLTDSPLDQDTRNAWSVYRQELRDLTNNIDENGEVEFPSAP